MNILSFLILFYGFIFILFIYFFRWRRTTGSLTGWVAAWVTPDWSPTWTGPRTPSTSAPTPLTTRSSSGTPGCVDRSGTSRPSVSWAGRHTTVPWAGGPSACGGRARTRPTLVRRAGTATGSWWPPGTLLGGSGSTPSLPPSPRACPTPTPGTAAGSPGSPGSPTTLNSSPRAGRTTPFSSGI